jgi:tetratricopeptide (TPR) repeat protein
MARAPTPPLSLPPRPFAAAPEAAGRDLEKALSDLIRAGELDRAAHVARAMGNPRYAARLFTEAKLSYQAAVCLYEAGDREASLVSFLEVDPSDARYRRACVQAIRVATELGVLTRRLDRFVDRFVEQPPSNDEEMLALYRIGVLYQLGELFDHACEAFAQVLRVDPAYSDAARRLAVIEAVLKNEELFRAIFRQDADAWRKPKSAARSLAPPSDTLVSSRSRVSTPLLPPGTVIENRYRIESEIGRGGMGIVFRAIDLELDEAIAIKVFSQRLDELDLVHRFKQELSLCRSLSHPNVIRLYDIGAHDGRKFISMELLAGKSLKAFVAERSPPLVAIRLLVQACAGVAAAHAQSVVHRDVKPDNLFVTTEGIVKLMDFGLAKRLVAMEGDAAEDITAAGFIGGSPPYMAPEQITEFGQVSFAADIYSLGVIAYELLTGVKPFHHEDRAKLQQMHMGDTPEPPSAKNPLLSPEVDAVVLRCLRKDPGARFRNCEELHEELSALAASAAP